MEVSTGTTTMKEDNNNYRNLRSDIVEQALHSGRINSPKRAQVILEGQRTGLSRETDVSPALSSRPGMLIDGPNHVMKMEFDKRFLNIDY